MASHTTSRGGGRPPLTNRNGPPPRIPMRIVSVCLPEPLYQYLWHKFGADGSGPGLSAGLRGLAEEFQARNGQAPSGA